MYFVRFIAPIIFVLLRFCKQNTVDHLKLTSNNYDQKFNERGKFQTSNMDDLLLSTENFSVTGTQTEYRQTFKPLYSHGQSTTATHRLTHFDYHTYTEKVQQINTSSMIILMGDTQQNMKYIYYLTCITTLPDYYTFLTKPVLT